MSEPERVLFVHAHPDDESIATGGTIATLVERGAHVTVLTCTRGERGEVIPDDLQYALESSETLAAVRQQELDRAFDVLGVDDHRFLGSHDARSAGRSPRRYVDSGMRWGSDGQAEPSGEFDPASLTAAEFGDVAADIAAVIVDMQPDVVVSYNARGGYGHPDHIRAAQAAQRAAEVYGVPFFAVEPRESAARATMTVDVSPVLDRKRGALEAHRSQITVSGDTFALSDGVTQPIDRIEKFRRVHSSGPGGRQRPGQPVLASVLAGIAAIALGLATGALLTVYHQSTSALASISVPLGLIVAIALVAALLAGLRLLFDSRLIATCAAVGVLAVVGEFSLRSAGGTILVPANGMGTAWSIAPTAIALVVLAWPKTLRRRGDRIAGQTKAKGPPQQ